MAPTLIGQGDSLNVSLWIRLDGGIVLTDEHDTVPEGCRPIGLSELDYCWCRDYTPSALELKLASDYTGYAIRAWSQDRNRWLIDNPKLSYPPDEQYRHAVVAGIIETLLSVFGPSDAMAAAEMMIYELFPTTIVNLKGESCLIP